MEITSIQSIGANSSQPNRLRPRIFAALAHLVISGAIAGALAAVVFGLWYPLPQRDMVGASTLFWLVVSVDVVMGPLLTLVVYNTTKTRAHLVRDLAVIGSLQLAALVFGANAVWLARPAIIAFEVDRLRVVTAAEIDSKSLAEEAPASLRNLPFGSPRMVSAVKPTEPTDLLRSLDLAGAGFDLGMQPGTWREFDDAQRQVMWMAGKPLSQLLSKAKEAKAQADLQQAVSKAKAATAKELRYLPIVSKRLYWTAFITESGELVGYAEIDPF